MKKFAVLFALLLAALAFAACGGGDDSSGDTSPAAGAVEDLEEGAEEAVEDVEEGADEAGEAIEGGAEEAQKEAEGGTEGSASAVDIEADPSGSLAFTTDSAEAKAGEVTVNFTNPSPVPHDVRIENSGGEDIGGTGVITESDESAEVEVKPGKYTFFCSVPGHRQAGMEGTLTVK